jgi:hypothetical protein
MLSVFRNAWHQPSFKSTSRGSRTPATPEAKQLFSRSSCCRGCCSTGQTCMSHLLCISNGRVLIISMQALYVYRRPEPTNDNAKPAQQQQGQSQVSASPHRPGALTTTTPAAATATAHLPLIIDNLTWWSRFLLFMCCVSARPTGDSR